MIEILKNNLLILFLYLLPEIESFVPVIPIIPPKPDDIENMKQELSRLQKEHSDKEGKRMKIFKEEEIEKKIFQFLEKLDPFDNQKFTFSECLSFFSSEIIKEKDINGNEKEISILEKICFKDNTNGNENEAIVLSNEINSNNNINNIGNNNSNK